MLRDETRPEHLQKFGWCPCCEEWRGPNPYPGQRCAECNGGKTEIVADEPGPHERINSAALYLIRRVQSDPEFRYHMIGTESLDRLVDACAEILDKPFAEVMDIVNRNKPQRAARCRPQ